MKGYYATPILPLARGKVRYVGEPVVGVVAQSRYLAEDAARTDRDRIRAAAGRHRSVEAVQDDAPLLHEEAGTNVIVSREFKRGDVDAALAAAPVRVEGRFRMHRKTAVAIEPRACLAEYDAGRDALTLHSATQVPGIVRDALADALDLSGHRHPRGRPRCRRRLRRQGLALSGGDFRLRGGAAARPFGEMDQRPHGGPDRPPARPSTRSSTPSSASTPTGRALALAPT